jgi:arylformamidase
LTKLIDITPPVRPGMAVFPGDAPCAVRQTFAIGPECPVNVTEVGGEERECWSLKSS